jgi:peptide/nickel transport system substrate-binding protein
LALAQPALAQKQGDILRVYHRDNLPSASIHEGATISTVAPFMSVFNNLVVYDQTKPLNTADTRLTFTLRHGVNWHDGKPFTANDIQFTSNKLTGKDADEFRKNARYLVA